MKKSACDIVRDLMPIVIDGVASSGSRELVENHVSACEECRKYFLSMKSELPEASRREFEEEQSRFIAALKKVRMRRLRRRIVAALIAIIIGAGAAFGGIAAYNWFYNDYSVIVDEAMYSIDLAKLKNGRIVITADLTDIDFSTKYTFSMQDDCVYICFKAPRVRHKSQNDFYSAKRYLGIMGEGIKEIRAGTPDDYHVIWRNMYLLQPGNDNSIQMASEEMEYYFSLIEYTQNHFSITSDSPWLQWQIEEARKAVPEWQ